MNKLDKNNLNEIMESSKKILKLFYVLMIVLAIYVLLIIVKELEIMNFILTILGLISPLFIGIVIAWLLNPLVKFLETKKVRRTLGTIFSYVLLIGCIIFMIQAIFPIVYKQGADLIENIPSIFSTLKKWLDKLIGNIDIGIINSEGIKTILYTKLDDFSTSIATTLPKNVINLITTAASSMGKLLIGLVIGFYLLLSANNFTNSLIEFIPRRYRQNTTKLFKNINKSLRNYVNGAIIDATVVFIISSTAFAILGLKAPILFGLFCGIMNVIPYAGPYIGGAPAVIIAFSQSVPLGIAILISIIIIQTIEGNVLQTIIISKTTKLHPVIIIIGLLIFGHFFGIVGMLLSTPILSVIKVLIKHFDDKYDILSFK